VTRRLLAFACRAFPRDHRARCSDEVVDTAVLASRGSAFGALREGLSLVRAGLSQRLRSESERSLRDGVRLLAGVLAVVNLAVAVAGVILVAHPRPVFHSCAAISSCGPMYPFVVDSWWIAFTVAAAGVVLGLVLGNRLLAACAAIANLALVAYDALFLVNGTDWFSGHLAAFKDFPVSQYWLPAAVELVLANATAPFRREPLVSLPLALAEALVLVLLSHEMDGSFLFLLWPLTGVVILAVVFGGVAPRLTVLAVGGVLVAAPAVVAYSTQHSFHHSSVVAWVAAGLGIGLLLPLTQLTRRRLT
jgi:hypothetical protein